MALHAILLVILIVGGTALLSWPLGRYMAQVMENGIGWINGSFHVIAGAPGDDAHDWKRYVFAMLAFNAVMFTLVFLLQATQQFLPLNPDGMGAVDPGVIFNTSASFTTNTNLQHYSGEATYSYLTQLGGLMWLQFVSAATGDRGTGGAGARAGRAADGQFLHRRPARGLSGPLAGGAGRRAAAGAAGRADDVSRRGVGDHT